MQADAFNWQRYPQAQAYVQEKLEELVKALPPLAAFRDELRTVTGTGLGDWLDHMVLSGGVAVQARLAALGFTPIQAPADEGDAMYGHPGAVFPPIVLRPSESVPQGMTIAAAIHVDSASRFLMTRKISVPIEGSPLAPFRRARVWQSGDGKKRELFVVERRAYRGVLPVDEPSDKPKACMDAFEEWAARPRGSSDPAHGMLAALSAARSLAEVLGPASAAEVVLSGERAYWQRRSRAAMVQKDRQESLGLGWANHDHHTFRSSRACFADLIRLFEVLGFRLRERYYAGAQAGWGAQIMEQPDAGLVVFADVDLAPDELATDFAHDTLPPRPELGTVGLWCALHGESILSAGMHHLACRMDYDAAVSGLAAWGVETMPPFADLPHLRQAFTRADQWKVSADRARLIEGTGHIDSRQAEAFMRDGAIGSHLEIIQRGEGFKGFNQKSVSDIIRRTDPRATMGIGAA
jgi:hypothetical protein